jgi:hypothetical protein
MESDITEANVRIALERRSKSPFNSLVGRLLDIRKNPHVTYVGLERFTIVK